MELLIIIIIFYLLIYFHKKKNIYENFTPDERQFNVCIDSELGNGETHLSVSSNQIPKSTQGFLTSLLGITEENIHGKHFNIQPCSSRNINNVKQYDYIFNHNIIDHAENQTIDDTFYNKNYHNPHPHSEFFVTYEYLDGKYDDTINLDFQTTHEKTIETDSRFGSP
jgi:hypothetical protein